MEDNMENNKYLTFEPRKWKLDAGSKNSKVERIFVTDMAGGLTEVISVGDWHWHWSSAVSPRMSLRANCDYIFTFWLNGGENQENTEFCQLRIHLGKDEKNPFVFNLNRNFINAVKYNSGWYRYEIPFNTGDSSGDTSIVHFEFNAWSAYAAFMPDKPEFANLPDEERPDVRIPQRHNIRFDGGYPRDRWYSHYAFGNTATYKEPQATTSLSGTLSGLTEDTIDKLQRLYDMGLDVDSVLERIL